MAFARFVKHTPNVLVVSHGNMNARSAIKWKRLLIGLFWVTAGDVLPTLVDHRHTFVMSSRLVVEKRGSDTAPRFSGESIGPMVVPLTHRALSDGLQQPVRVHFLTRRTHSERHDTGRRAYRCGGGIHTAHRQIATWVVLRRNQAEEMIVLDFLCDSTAQFSRAPDTRPPA